MVLSHGMYRLAIPMAAHKRTEATLQPSTARPALPHLLHHHPAVLQHLFVPILTRIAAHAHQTLNAVVPGAHQTPLLL